jgi:hypothetical protein
LHPERVPAKPEATADPEKPSADGWHFSGEDDEFEQFAKELEAETSDPSILYPGTRLIPHGEAAPIYIEAPDREPDDTQVEGWEDVPFPEQ